MSIVCFIILHYNCFEETKSCVDSIMALEQQERIRIVVVDNASENDSYRSLQAEYEDNAFVSLLHNPENLGFSRANNIGYEYAQKHFDLDFVIFANNDVIFVQKDFLNRIDKEFQRSKFAVCGPDILKPGLGGIHQNPMGKEIVRSKSQVRKTIFLNRMALLFFPIIHSFLNKSEEEAFPLAEEEPQEYAVNVLLCGACMIFSAAFLREKKVPFFPETFFYYEEYILSYYCLKHGKSLVYAPELKVYHNHGAATKSLGSNKEREKFRMKNIMLSAKCYLQLLRN